MKIVVLDGETLAAARNAWAALGGEPHLRFIAVTAAGHDCVDVEAARRRGIPVANVPEYGTDSVAQLTFALPLELCHRAGLHADAVRAGERGGRTGSRPIQCRRAGARPYRTRRRMITSDLLEILRCPMDPQRAARLEETPEGLACQRCRLTFPVREGIPCMLVDEATLPAGCASLASLPCQQTPAALAPGGATPS